MGIFKKSLWFSLGTVLSRLIGMVRDILMARFFGSGVLSEAFFVAFRIPNLFRDMFAEGALSQAFTKTYSQLEGQHQEKFIQQFIGNLLVLCTALSFLGIWLSPVFVDWMTFWVGSDPSKVLLVDYAKKASSLMFVILPIFMMASVFMGALTKHGQFFVSAVGSVFFNIGYILGIILFPVLLNLVLDPSFDESFMPRSLFGLCIGVVFGAFLQLGLFVWKLGDFINVKKLKFGISPEIKGTLLLMLPAAMAASTGPINNVINTNFATSLEAGSVSWLSYAFRIFHLPVAIFAVALGAALMPTAAALVKKNKQKFVEQFRKSLVGTMWVMSFFTVCTFLAAQSVVFLLFKRGEFSVYDVLMTSTALKAYSFGLIGYSLVKIMIVYFYATDRTSVPLKIAGVCVFLNFGLNYFLTQYFSHVAIAMTASFVLSFNAFLLILVMSKSESEFLKGLLQQEKWLFVAILLAALSYILQKYLLFHLFPVSSYANAVIHIAIIGIVSTIMFAFCACKRLKKNPRELWQWLKSQRKSPRPN